MTRITLSFIVMVTLGCAIGHTFAGDPQIVLSESMLSWKETCKTIEREVSTASKVYYDHDSAEYQDAIKHWVDSSTQYPVCSFVPGTPDDIGIALHILGKTRTPFAVKGGGHNTNPGFSSTLGVQISMSKFSEIVYNPEKQTATIGAGQIWDNVYKELNQYGVNVVGGRVPGVGVAGFTLGGGYSWLTNQHGLTIDTVEAFELVLPDGTVIEDVTETSSPDLFFALKGGLNNFGIVTRFTLKTFGQKQVWGGYILYSADDVHRVNAATAKFSAHNRDPRAAIITSYNYFEGQLLPVVVLFFDAPEEPAGLFDEFLALDSLKLISIQSFSDFVQSLPTIPSRRAVFNTISVTAYPLDLIETIVSEIYYWAQKLPKDADTFMSYDVEPFCPSLLTHNKTPSAYPPNREKGFFPLSIYYGWNSADFDEDFYDAIRTSTKTLEMHAGDDSSDLADMVVYPNYAIFNTSLDKLYGENLQKLKDIKKVVDPENVMNLAGGFKL